MRPARARLLRLTHRAILRGAVRRCWPGGQGAMPDRGGAWIRDGQRESVLNQETKDKMSTQTQEPRASIFTPHQEQELLRLKSYRPYRIVWGAIDRDGNFEVHADTTRHKLNRYLR